VARLVGLTALGALGALQWQRLIGGLSSGRALLWVLVAVLAALGVLASERVTNPRLRADKELNKVLKGTAYRKVRTRATPVLRGPS